MNSKIKGIIICLVVVLCLGATLLVLNFLPDKKDDSSSSSKETSSAEDKIGDISLMSGISDELDKTNVYKIELKNSKGEFAVEQTSLGAEEWKIKALDGINQSQTLYSAMATTTGSLKAKKVVDENAADLSKYGLDDPTAEFTVTFHADGKDTEKSFLIGDVAPDKNYYYICENGANKVYTVYASTVSYYFYAKEDFISLSMLSALPSDADETYFTSLTVKQRSRDYDIVFKTDDDLNNSMVSSQVMTSPIFSYLDITNSSVVTHGMWGLTAQRAVVAHPTEEDFEKYGLSDPLSTATLVCKDGTYVLKIGNCEYVKDSEGGDTSAVDGYYAYMTGVDGIDVIYYCAADDLPWAAFKPDDVISGLMTTNSVYKLKDVKVKTADKDLTYTLTVSEKDSDGNQTVEKVLENGKTEIDPEAWKSWYQLLIQCPTSELYFTDPESDTPDITINIDLADGTGDVMELYKQTDRRYVVKLNSKTSFRIESGWVDAFINGIDKIRSGEEVNADNY